MSFLAQLRRIAGVEINRVSHAERVVSIAGGFVSILIVYLISHAMEQAHALFLVASMGASAVLLFAAPHSAFSQPWSVAGGHGLSALAGVSCVLVLGGGWFSAAVAVALAIGVMHYLHCIHPPGGATALTAVLAAGAADPMGYWFVLTVMLNAGVMLLVAIGFNALFKWRRYPAALYNAVSPKGVQDPYPDITHAEFVAALAEIDTFIDVSEQDLLRIYALVTRTETHGKSADEAASPTKAR